MCIIFKYCCYNLGLLKRQIYTKMYTYTNLNIALNFIKYK